MALLVDTSVAVRLRNTRDPLHFTASYAVIRLHLNGQSLHSTAQVAIEFRAVATRPASANGLGLTSERAAQDTAELLELFQLLPDNAAIFPLWSELVDDLGVIGKQVHDARLVAVCRAHGLDGIVTFNEQHFRRLCAYWPNLRVISPASVF